MRYSNIIGQGFYRIALSPDSYELLDIYFSGASHHLYRFREAMKVDPTKAKLHLEKHRAHLRSLMTIVHDLGSFTFAQDPSGRRMNMVDSWDPALHSTPDPDMFNSMLPDMRYKLGEGHPYDQHLVTQIRPNLSQNVHLIAHC